MFNIEFYDDPTMHLFSPWWMYMLMGINFILLAVLIFLMPELLAYLVGAFLFFNGILFLGIAWSAWSIKGKYRKWKTRHRIPVN
ncbi:MAG: hypothetical protein KatS3mg031_1829 [Chitinophagales bacterium]|nr:MAG: hypothetical protein KatS3mg031_1829 [Chitinophagales bacterium]